MCLAWRRFLICRIGDLESAERCSQATVGRLKTCDTAQHGGATTKGARVCDPQELCLSCSVLTNPARRPLSTCCDSQSRAGPRLCEAQRFRRTVSVANNWSLLAHTCCGSQSRAPQHRRCSRRFGQILIDCKSALRARQARQTHTGLPACADIVTWPHVLADARLGRRDACPTFRRACHVCVESYTDGVIVPGQSPPATGSAASPLPKIADHDLLHVIGRGAYGEVWLARHVQLGTLRAIKIIRRDQFGDARPFTREFDGIQKYEPISRSHPNLVSILHVGGTDDYFYYVMELADDAKVGQASSLSGVDGNSDAQTGKMPVPLYAPHTLRSAKFWVDTDIIWASAPISPSSSACEPPAPAGDDAPS